LGFTWIRSNVYQCLYHFIFIYKNICLRKNMMYIVGNWNYCSIGRTADLPLNRSTLQIPLGVNKLVSLLRIKGKKRDTIEKKCCRLQLSFPFFFFCDYLPFFYHPYHYLPFFYYAYQNGREMRKIHTLLYCLSKFFPSQHVLPTKQKIIIIHAPSFIYYFSL